jgi:hypothetical protein
MKKFLFCLFAAIAVMGTGCSKDDDDDAVAEKASVTVEGTALNFKEAQWYENEAQGGFFVSAGNGEATSNGIVMTMKTKKVGTITLDDDNDINITNGSTYYRSVSGTITVTKWDSKSLVATFTGKFAKGLLSTNTVDVTGTISAVNGL